MKTKHDNRCCRLKTWSACLSIAAVPIYATTFLLMGMTATVDRVISSSTISSSAATTHPPYLERGISPRGTSRQEGSRGRYRTIAEEIAARWNLTSPEAPRLLERQFYRANDYDPRTDFLHFHHIPKTGGTSVSDMINATIGALADGHRGILPGSAKSSTFEPKNFYDLTGISQMNRGGVNMEFPYIASYAHTRLRPTHGPNKSDMATFFEEYFALPHNSPKRLRSLAMLREPMNLRASNLAMAMCALNGKVNDFNWRRKREGLEPVCTPEQGLNISRLFDPVVDTAMTKCPHGIERVDRNVKLDRYERILCKRGRTAMDYCRSPTHLLRSNIYKSGMRSMMRGLMGRFTAQQKMDTNDYVSVEKHLQKIGLGFSTEKVEEYTLIDLGGLDPNITHAPYDGLTKNYTSLGNSDGTVANYAEPDFLWFGITERMKESTCLFYYALDVRPLPEIPRMRVMNCPPTSWWTEEHREEVKRKEPADYAVWRAANAILDARVARMREEVRQKLENERDLTPKARDRYRALADAGCLEEQITI